LLRFLWLLLLLKWLRRRGGITFGLSATLPWSFMLSRILLMSLGRLDVDEKIVSFCKDIIFFASIFLEKLILVLTKLLILVFHLWIPVFGRTSSHLFPRKSSLEIDKIFLTTGFIVSLVGFWPSPPPHNFVMFLLLAMVLLFWWRGVVGCCLLYGHQPN